MLVIYLLILNDYIFLASIISNFRIQWFLFYLLAKRLGFEFHQVGKIISWDFSEENVILKNKDKGFGKHTVFEWKDGY